MAASPGDRRARRWQSVGAVHAGCGSGHVHRAYTRLTPADIHADIHILIRKADGTVRGIIAENVADTRSILDFTLQTVSNVYYFPGYTVVGHTYYLEIDLFAEATSNVTSTVIVLSFSNDDSSLVVADQSRI